MKLNNYAGREGLAGQKASSPTSQLSAKRCCSWDSCRAHGFDMERKWSFIEWAYPFCSVVCQL